MIMTESDQELSELPVEVYAPRILLTEADHGIRAFLVAGLKTQKKYRIYEAPTLKAVMQQIRSQPIDILVLGHLVEHAWYDQDLMSHLIHFLKQNLDKVKQCIFLLPQEYIDQIAHYTVNQKDIITPGTIIPHEYEAQYFKALRTIYQMFSNGQIQLPQFMTGQYPKTNLAAEMIKTRYREYTQSQQQSDDYDHPIRQHPENLHGLDLDLNQLSSSELHAKTLENHLQSLINPQNDNDTHVAEPDDSISESDEHQNHIHLALRPQVATAIASIENVAYYIKPNILQPQKISHSITVEGGNTVLWVGPQDHNFNHEIQKACHALNLKFKGVVSAQKALRATRGTRFELAFVYDQLDDMSGLSLVRSLRREIGESLPIAFITPTLLQVSDRLEGVHAGVSLFLNEEASVDLLTQSIRQLQTLGTHGSAKVLVIDDDESLLVDHVTQELSHSSFQISCLTSPFRVLELLSEIQTDLLIVHADMQDLGGIEVCRTLRATPEWQSLPMILMGERNDDEMHLAAYRSGADDYLPSYTEGNLLKACLESRLERSRMIQERADRDGLTGLLVRRAFNDALQTRMATARRKGSSVAVCLIDLDHFKNINDTYGHIAGDKVLSALGRLLSSSFRVEDLRGRWGGEEFVVSFSDEEADNAAIILERARKEFVRFEFESDQGGTFQATFSAGIACFPENGDHIEEVFKVADDRLYQVKETGRNRILAYDLVQRVMSKKSPHSTDSIITSPNSEYAKQSERPLPKPQNFSSNIENSISHLDQSLNSNNQQESLKGLTTPVPTPLSLDPDLK
jgi:diguanylate cyclase (GGDEF)-like protein